MNLVDSFISVGFLFAWVGIKGDKYGYLWNYF